MSRARLERLRKKQRLVVGITGVFGSGKSSAGRVLKRLGARRVIDCDRLAHEVFRPGHPLRKRIRSLFDIRGPVTRKSIAREVFSNARKRRRLEQVIHPYVRRRIQEELRAIRRGVVVLEVPLLFETRFDRLCDMTVAVVAGPKAIAKHLRRKGFSQAQIRARLKAQWPEREKKRRADLFFDNSGPRKNLALALRKTWNNLKSVLGQNHCC